MARDDDHEHEIAEDEFEASLDDSKDMDKSVEEDFSDEEQSSTAQTQPTEQYSSQEQSSAPQKGADEVFCSSCGEVIKQEAEICPHCGVRQNKSSAGTVQKNPGVAAAASFLFTGLGQVYNGQIMKGVLFIVIQFINIALMFAVIGFITFPIVWFYGIYDAYNTAQRINTGEIQV